MNLPILNRDASGNFKHPEDGWYHVIPTGRFPHPSGMTQVLDGPAHAAIVNRFREEATKPNFAGLLIDQEHFSYDTEKSSAAYGWLTALENRTSGTWAKIKWTPEGKKAVEDGTYRFISPVWLPTEVEKLGNKEIRPRRLDTAGLTNTPNLKGMVPLSNRDASNAPADRNQTHDKPMKKVNALLGLSEDAAEEAAIAEITKFKNRAAKAETLETENAELRTAQVESDLAKYSNRIKPESKEAVKAQLLANRAGTIALLDSIPEPKAEVGGQRSAAVRQPLHQRGQAATPAPVTNRVSADELAEKQMAAVNAYKNSHKVDFESAWEAVKAEKPELFEMAEVAE